MRLERGTVVLLELDPAVGHEQRGVRPCVVELGAIDQGIALFLGLADKLESDPNVSVR